MEGDFKTLKEEIAIISEKIEESLLDFFNKLPEDDLTNIIRYHMGWLNKNFEKQSAYKGKRLRPVLCSLICKLTGGVIEDSYPPGIALELTHNFSLVHDDIQDKDLFRRGRETVWSIWGVAQGINVGDAMIALSHRAILDSSLSYEKKCKLIALLDNAIFRLCQGQFLDISFESNANINIDDYLLMVQGKTCSMFEASVGMGIIVSDREELMNKFISIARNLGLAFQILDDILGLWGDPKITGKPVGSDLRQNKKTYPIILGIKEFPNIRGTILKRDKTDKEIEYIISELEDYGVKERCQREVARYLLEARKMIEDLPLGEEERNLLLELTYYLESRDR